MTLPNWINPENWEGYLEMRKLIKKPMTERAKQMAIRRLEEHRRSGHDPNQILDTATFNSWQGLYPPKVLNTVNYPEKPQPKVGESMDEYMGRLRALTESKRAH
jgi:hypothetical protein